MINFDGKDVAAEFQSAFGIDASTLTAHQLWWLTKFAKHIRGRCRNNSAFNNYMNRNFAPAKFHEVPKEYQGRQYKGLEITANNVTLGQDGEE